MLERVKPISHKLRNIFDDRTIELFCLELITNSIRISKKGLIYILNCRKGFESFC